MYDVTALGEVLIDFACLDVDGSGYPTMKANPGGAPCNFLAALSAYGAKTAFLGKVGADAFGNMLLVGSQYWTMVHGKTPEDVRRDEEGLQTMRVLARKMAWVLKCLEAGKAAGVPLPEGEERIYTSFIR